MKVAQTIGSVTLSRCHPSLVGARWTLVVPQTLANLQGRSSARGEAIVAFDERGSGYGSLVAVSEGAEAAQPFRPRDKPIDAYAAAILDAVEVSPES